MFFRVLEFCDLLDTCLISFNLHLFFWFFFNTPVPFEIFSLEAKITTDHVVQLVRLNFSAKYGGLALAKSVLYYKFLQYVTFIIVTIIDALPQSSYVIVIEEYRGDPREYGSRPPLTTLSTANSANLYYDPTYRQRSLQPGQPRNLLMAIAKFEVFLHITHNRNLTNIKSIFNNE